MNLFSPNEKVLEHKTAFLGEHRLAAMMGWKRLIKQPFQMAGAVLLISLTVSLLVLFSISYQKSYHIASTLSSQLIITPVDGLSSDQLSRLQQDICEGGLLTHCHITSVQDILDKFPLESDIGNARLPSIVIAEYPPSLSLQALGELQSKLQNHSDIASFDLDWLWSAQLSQWIFLANTGIFFLGVMLTMSVVLVINYVITLFMDRYQKEIQVMYHLGASEKFIKRPYLYQGLFLGLSGAMGAIAMLSLLMLALGGTINSLLDLYEVSWASSTQEQMYTGLIIVGVVLLSLMSSGVSTRKWLSAFEKERIRCY